MKTTGMTEQQSSRTDLLLKARPGAFSLSAPFLLGMGIIGMLPWVAG